MLAAATAGTAAAIAIDATTQFWIDNPMTAGLIAGVLLLGVTLVLVDAWVDYRAAQTWTPVAAFALQDLGRIARAVWVRNASFIQPLFEAMHIEQFRQQITSAEGAEQQRVAMGAIATDPARRDALFKLLHETAERTRDLIMRWAPIMVSRSPLAEYLGRFADTHRQIVKALGWLHHVQAGRPLPVDPLVLRDQVLLISRLALELDRDCFIEAEWTAPLPLGDQLVRDVAQ